MAVSCHKYAVGNTVLGLFATGDGRSVPCQRLQTCNRIRILCDSCLMAFKIYGLQIIEKPDNYVKEKVSVINGLTLRVTNNQYCLRTSTTFVPIIA